LLIETPERLQLRCGVCISDVAEFVAFLSEMHLMGKRFTHRRTISPLQAAIFYYKNTSARISPIFAKSAMFLSGSLGYRCDHQNPNGQAIFVGTAVFFSAPVSV